MYEEKMSGFYEIYKDKVYKSGNGAIKEIDVREGKLLKTIKDASFNGFVPSGEFLVTDEVVVLKDTHGEVLLLNRETFEVMDYIKMDARLGSNKNNLVWHNNHLYILDISNNLYIFKKEENV